MLLDIGLPDMDGYEVARRIRSMPGHAHVRLVASLVSRVGTATSVRSDCGTPQGQVTSSRQTSRSLRD
ncbi:hypothetical protein [Cupriavidus sp. YAF13]|uniref:hypothetical protein n=1 Tax=Cupriavidus sp. YAF13 TaxID=3233075 RepID=UPI003F92DBD2